MAELKECPCGACKIPVSECYCKHCPWVFQEGRIFQESFADYVLRSNQIIGDPDEDNPDEMIFGSKGAYDRKEP